MADQMRALKDDFKPCTFYESWMAPDDRYSVVACAQGPFKGPHPRIPSKRAAKEKARQAGERPGKPS